MNSIFQIPTKKLFLIACLVKILSSVVTLAFASGSLNLLFWIFAGIIPLIAMLLYIWVGYNRADRSLSDEKFADSCYYLGFLFTIVSIVVSLIDLPSIGTNLNQIAVRFGVAMASTALGMGVRVYLVNFKRESNDAIGAAEDAIIISADRFLERLNVASETYTRFEISVNNSTNNVIEHVRQRVEQITNEYLLKLEAEQIEATKRIGDVTAEVLMKLEQSIIRFQELEKEVRDQCKKELESYFQSLTGFSTRLVESIDKSALPADFFSKRLEPSLTSLITELETYKKGMVSSTQELASSSKTLSLTLDELNSRRKAAVKSLETLQSFAIDSKILLNEQKDISESLRGILDKLVELINLSKDKEKQPDPASLASQVVSEMTKEIIDLGKHNHEEIKEAIRSVVDNLSRLVGSAATSSDRENTKEQQNDSGISESVVTEGMVKSSSSLIESENPRFESQRL